MSKADVLIFAAHPDDAELACAGTIASLVAEGKKVVIADLTRGEMGTRGTAETRGRESAEASRILGIADRICLSLPDTRLENTREMQLHLIRILRHYRPDLVLCNAVEDRHPDHGAAGNLASASCFYSGLTKIETERNGGKQEAFRPGRVLHYIQDRYIVPGLVVDITPYWPVKMAAIQAFQTQFHNPGSPEPETYISRPDFLDFIEARAREMGQKIGVRYGEGFTSANPPGFRSLSSLV
jgi:bacillithiol biosynthesis deacetylase BshB1